MCTTSNKCHCIDECKTENNLKTNLAELELKSLRPGHLICWVVYKNELKKTNISAVDWLDVSHNHCKEYINYSSQHLSMGFSNKWLQKTGYPKNVFNSQQIR